MRLLNAFYTQLWKSTHVCSWHSTSASSFSFPQQPWFGAMQVGRCQSSLWKAFSMPQADSLVNHKQRNYNTTVLSTTLVPSNQHIPPYFERSTLYQRRLDTYSAMWLCTENNCIFHIPTSKAYHCSSLTACSLFTSPHTHGRKQRWRQQSPCFLRGRYPTFSFYRPNHTTEGNKFYLYGTHLSEFMPMVQEVWKVGVPQICFRFGRLPVGVPASNGFYSIQRDGSFKRPYSLSDPGGWRNIWDLLHKSFQMMSIFFEDQLSTSQERNLNRETI